MPVRMLVAACAVMLAACGGGSGPGGLAGPSSAQTVAQSSNDFPGLQKCPQSGSYDDYLKAEQTANPTQYQSDKTRWDDLKKAGANDSFVAAYGSDNASCGQVGSPASAPTGKFAEVLAFRFKDSASAAASYKSQGGAFNLSSSAVSSLQAAGGTVKLGAETGLGENSSVITVSVQGVSLYVALWQNREFDAAILVYNLPLPAGAQATTSVNSRIH